MSSQNKKKYVYTVFSGPTEGMEEEYNRWYNNQHLPEVMAVPGIVNAQRFKITEKNDEAPSSYLAIYEIETDGDPNKIVDEIRARVRDGKIVMSEAIDINRTKPWMFAAIEKGIEMTMTSVKDLMTKNVITIDLSKTLFDAAFIMSEKKIGCLVVMDGNKPVGMVTERDFVRRVVSKKIPLDTEISEVMSKPLIVIDQDSNLLDLSRLMRLAHIRRVVVVNGRNELVGILVASDLARQLSKKPNKETIEVMTRG